MLQIGGLKVGESRCYLIDLLLKVHLAPLLMRFLRKVIGLVNNPVEVNLVEATLHGVVDGVHW